MRLLESVKNVVPAEAGTPFPLRDPDIRDEPKK
jgi:hypothetical protein